MTDPQDSIFDPTPPKNSKFSAALWCMGGFAGVLLIENIYDLVSNHEAVSDRNWLVPGIFIGLPLIGLLLLTAKRKVGWYIAIIYFLFLGIGVAGTQLVAILRSYYGSSAWYVFDLRENVFMLIAITCIYLLLHRETQQLLAIRSKDRIWTISIAAVLLAAFFAWTAQATFSTI